MIQTSKPLICRALMAAAIIPSVSMLTACTGDCNGVAAPSVYGTVVDAATGLAPTSIPTVLVSDGITSDTAVLYYDPPPQSNLPKFVSRSTATGQFRVTVTASGYQALVREGIRVTADRCGQIRQAEITARIAPVVAP